MALLKITNLSVRYDSVEAIQGIDMSIEEKRITAILGSNGAGKTTVINAISGLVKYDGKIEYDGSPLTTKTNIIVKSGIVQVPEGRRVFAGLTVEENLRLGAFVHHRSEIAELIERQFSLFPLLKERRAQDAGTLSGGEQQMLAIARGLMGKPRLLMLDEPSLGLAPLIVKDVFETIQEIRDQGITVMLVEQNAQKSLSICDYSYVIENGKIVLSGTGAELLNNELVANAYLGASRQ
jgi:branched-chain amino acid transport system ATP-binding protein